MQTEETGAGWGVPPIPTMHSTASQQRRSHPNVESAQVEKF